MCHINVVDVAGCTIYEAESISTHIGDCFLLGCGGQTADTAIPQNSSDQRAAGEAFVREILDSLQGNSGWMPPLPPSGGERPRILTEEEKDRVLEIASAVPQVIEAKRNQDVVSVDMWYLWVGWIGHANGVSYIMYEPIESGIKDLSNYEDTYYPAVEFIFNSKFGEFGICGINVAVNLETEKVVYISGFNASAIPKKLPPP